MKVKRVGKIRRLIPIPGTELAHGMVKDMNNGREYVIEVPAKEYQINEVVLFSPLEGRTTLRHRWVNVTLAKVEKV